ncbi:unnamed protein product [Durusdinium trenchii]|uniref:Uncharacterized protein n=1 Tax=Durusdinium trenchii TaxID=1381693 RepID=A0ABP0NB20_9DINO
MSVVQKPTSSLLVIEFQRLISIVLSLQSRKVREGPAKGLGKNERTFEQPPHEQRVQCAGFFHPARAAKDCEVMIVMVTAHGDMPMVTALPSRDVIAPTAEP